MSATLLAEIAVIVVCLAGGGLLKGATGAGAPVLAVPALATFFDVRFAVIVMLVPNLLTNLWQAVRFRAHLLRWPFMLPLLAGGFVGAGLGTMALKTFDPDLLSLCVAVAALLYVVLRLSRPHWILPMGPAHWLSAPAGLLAGMLQGGAGLSAPVSITFLNALRLPRESFIATISVLFVTFTVVQLAIASTNGLIRENEIFYSLFALVPVSLAMPLGAALASRVSPQVLDRVILAILAVLSAKLLVEALF
ncbi:sulfite exporter TauE/SafE family protein [Aquibium sp. ELW1220]|uniref:sulfite exporter TauE/SafE family protein n=1 Tax=Aquibium sp. ELW1220 TaxID=2976766 RepID=UPI0025B139F4|nr:sulfite exporter TauE/SafE family protein [Aquibium sp. ELW1220]MDN2581329.1 sulfite exporter TauE/SafE family protein [Aquibium sp. ELW1220]